MTVRCTVCKGTNVEYAVWFNPNTNTAGDLFGSWNAGDNTFCADCDANTDLEDSEETADLDPVQEAIVKAAIEVGMLPLDEHAVDRVHNIPPMTSVPGRVCAYCGVADLGCDCKERIHCAKAGQGGHRACGICPAHDNQPRFFCLCPWPDEARR